jgi:hypothetical protein
MGSYICGQIPRVRSMRKWFGQFSAEVRTLGWLILNYEDAAAGSTADKSSSRLFPFGVPQPETAS